MDPVLSNDPMSNAVVAHPEDIDPHQAVTAVIKANIESWYALPFMELLFQAHQIHRAMFNVNEIELCTLLSVKTGTCPEDCAYCPQSGHYRTEVQKVPMLSLDAVRSAAHVAKANGATRFCIGAAWRNPPVRDFSRILEMIRAIKALGLEACATLGMLDCTQAEALKAAGLDFYNHNLDTSPEYYEKIISTRVYQDRLDTLACVRAAGIHVCCGGIVGMGESREDRIAWLMQLAALPHPPDSVPINRLIPVKGTPLAEMPCIDHFEFVRTIAIARLMMPKAVIRLSAGRESMSEEMHALCFMAGANSIFFGDTLLTVTNAQEDADLKLFKKLGIQPKTQANPL